MSKSISGWKCWQISLKVNSLLLLQFPLLARVPFGLPLNEKLLSHKKFWGWLGTDRAGLEFLLGDLGPLAWPLWASVSPTGEWYWWYCLHWVAEWFIDYVRCWEAADTSPEHSRFLTDICRAENEVASGDAVKKFLSLGSKREGEEEPCRLTGRAGS